MGAKEEEEAKRDAPLLPRAETKDSAAADQSDLPEPSEKAKRRAELVRAQLALSDISAENKARGHPQVAVVYDMAMELHRGPEAHPEQPGRIRQVVAQLQLAGLLDVCCELPAREATEEELEFVHTPEHVQKVLHGAGTGSRRKAKAYTFPFGPDTYVCEHTPQAARLAAGCPLQLVDSAFDDEDSSRPRCGLAVVRPPGHHATQDKASGFCLFNNVAVAARYAQRRYGIQRVAIIDWDVHHGNGTNDIFTDDDSILFFSMHRFDPQGFFPGTGTAEDLGHGEAKGFTVNVPMDKGYADVDVCHVVKYVLCPLIERFRPELILVSAGFDAVKGDPLGECRMSPEGFGWFVRCLHRLAKHFCDGRLLLLLEGGYDPDLIAQCCVECMRALVTEAACAPGLMMTFPDTPDVTSAAASTVPSGASTPVTASPAASPVLTGLSPKMSPQGSPRHHFASSPQHSPWVQNVPYSDHNKHKGPSVKTVRTVRRITEMHHALQLEMPLAPKQADGGGSEIPGAKAERKKERRRQQQQQQRHRGSRGSVDDDFDAEASSDSSGWAIACGSDDEAPWPPSSPAGALRRSPSHTLAVMLENDDEEMNFELPPPFPTIDPQGQGGAAAGKPLAADQEDKDDAQTASGGREGISSEGLADRSLDPGAFDGESDSSRPNSSHELQRPKAAPGRGHKKKKRHGR